MESICILSNFDVLFLCLNNFNEKKLLANEWDIMVSVYCLFCKNYCIDIFYKHHPTNRVHLGVFVRNDL